jgi:uncharacterized protein YigE (DUF2233 family)
MIKVNFFHRKINTAVFLSALICFFYQLWIQQVNPQNNPSIVRRNLTKTIQGEKIEINIAQINPNQVKVRVYSLVSQDAPSYTLGELVNKLKPQAAINGGFSSSYSIPTPTGLLVSNGKTLYRMNVNTVNVVTNGILCVGQTTSIIMKNDYKKSTCSEALEAGPILISAGKIDKRIDELQKKFRIKVAERSVIAIDKQGRLLLIRVNTPLTLSVLANLLTQKDLDCVSALNLSGSKESGLYINTQGKKFQVGRLDSPIASAIAVFQN